MKIHELKLTATPNRKRVGRGIAAGQGKTAGRGTKGQKARTGGGVRPGFEGGQNPLAKRLPKKRGFASLARKDYQPVNIGQLERFRDGSTVDNAALAKAGLVKYADRRVKLLSVGDIKKKLTVKVQASSHTAKAKIEAAGGTMEVVTLEPTKPKVAAKAS